MIPSPTERDELFKRFARALFKGHMDALYHVVTPEVDRIWAAGNRRTTVIQIIASGGFECLLRGEFRR